MYNYTRNISAFNQGKCITSIWNDEVQKVVTSVSLIQTVILNDVVTTTFSGTPTTNELVLIDTLASTIDWAALEIIILTSTDVLVGTVIFDRDKVKNISFGKTFEKKPFVDIVLGDNSTAVPYKTNVTKTGFTIIFSINYSGSIDWRAI